MGSMGMVLDRARRYAEVYRTESENAWGEIKAHHDQAMVVRGVEDVMDLGIGVMKSWFRTAGFWHEWVSEDHKRYEESNTKS